MTATHLAMLVALLPLLAMSAGISATETALFSLSYADRGRLRRLHPGASRFVERLLSRPRGLLITILLVNNLVNVLYFVLTSVLAQTVEHAAWSVIISIGALFALILAGEVVPKLLARGYPGPAAMILAPPFAVIEQVIRPLLGVLERGIISPLLRLIGPSPSRRGRGHPQVSVEELSALLELSARYGHIEPSEQRLLAEVVELGTILVREVMTPRVDMIVLEETARPREIQEAVRQTGRDAFPLCRGGLDGQILGMLNARAFLSARALQKSEPRLHSFISPPQFVPESSRLDQLLEEFRRGEQDQALVVNEFGGTVGLVELRDIVRELVRIPSDDEDQVQEQVRLISQGPPAQWLVGGRLPARELAEFFLGSSMATEWSRRATTAGGLVILLLGRIPRVGDVVHLGKLRLEVHSVRGRVVESVLLSMEPEEVEARATGVAP
jgi:putative hemolysin